MVNKETKESWGWSHSLYSNLNTNQEIDFPGSSLQFFLFLSLQKLLRVFASLSGFMVISFICGLTFRILFHYEVVIVIPINWLEEKIRGRQVLTPAQRAFQYHRMGIIGAQAAYYERTN